MTNDEVRKVRICRIHPGAEPEFLDIAADRTVWDVAFGRSLMPTHVRLHGMGRLFPELVAGTDAYVNDNGMAEDQPNKLASMLAGQHIYGTLVIFGPYNFDAEMDEHGEENEDAYAGMTSIPPEVEHALTPVDAEMIVIQGGVQ